MNETPQRGGRLGWIAAGVLAVIAIAQAGALAALVPLKTVAPYTITVDRQTGYVETARGLQLGPLKDDEAVTQANIVQYVLARETFDANDIRENYTKVALWSDGEARQSYIRSFDRANPASILNTTPQTSVVRVTVKNVSLLDRDSALVRFETERTDQGALTGERRPFVAVMSFRYVGAAMRNEDRFINPLGFQVTKYRRDAESVAPLPVPLEPAQ